MAIKQMHCFDLVVATQYVDELLIALSDLGTMTFRSLRHEADETFQPLKLPDPQTKQRQLATVQQWQKRLKQLGKRFGVSLPEFTIPQAGQALQAEAQEIDLEQMLSVYDRRLRHLPAHMEGYQVLRSWTQTPQDTDELHHLMQEKPIIGMLPSKQRNVLKKRLGKLPWYLALVQETPAAESVLMLFVTKAHRQQAKLIVSQLGMTIRSAASLGIEAEIDDVRALMSRLLMPARDPEHTDVMSQSLRYRLQVLEAWLSTELRNHEAKQCFLSGAKVVRMSGWVFSDDLERFSQLVETTTQGVCDLRVTEATHHDTEVPIALDNKRWAKPFELITTMFAWPRYDEIDPTPLLAPFYALFFGMMLADAGYGLVMLIAMLVAGRFIKDRSQGIGTYISFLQVLSIPTIIWGLIYGSFFGNLVTLPALIDLNTQFMDVLVLALVFGVVHIFYALCIKGWLYLREYAWYYALFDVGFWLLTLSGSIGLVSLMFTDLLLAYRQVFLVMMVAGMIGIVLTNGREAKSAGGKLASGLYHLYGLTNYLGDIISYSRLMALGLAGSSIALAFNMMLRMVIAFPVIGVLAGLVIFVVGHGFNILISGFSAYVHSARLTYVEFFGKFYTGGGRPFTAFGSGSIQEAGGIEE